MTTWYLLRKAVWERDGGICQVCRDAIAPKYYECGHVIDRCVGGADEIDNLVVMCNVCNRMKPSHRTRAEYDQWAASPPHLKIIHTVIHQWLRDLKWNAGLNSTFSGIFEAMMGLKDDEQEAPHVTPS